MAGLILKEESFAYQRRLYDRMKRGIDDAAFFLDRSGALYRAGGRLIIDTEIFIAVLPQTFVLTFGLFCPDHFGANACPLHR